MGYYHRGDYYRGDYYRGDPFLGGLIGSAARALGVGKIAAKAGRWLAGKITPGAVKTAAGVAGAGATAITIAGALPSGVSGGRMPVNIGPLGIDPGSALPGGQPLFTWGRKKYRRMNPLNPRALKRALRRAEGFEKFAKRTVNALYKTSDGRRTKKFKKCTPSRG
jgi:hypothetical protein